MCDRGKSLRFVIEITAAHRAIDFRNGVTSEGREVAMLTIASKRRSSFGIECVQCDSELIAPERSEYFNGSDIRHIWRCGRCDCCFEVISPADTKSIEDIMARIAAIVTWEDNSPSRLVA